MIKCEKCGKEKPPHDFFAFTGECSYCQCSDKSDLDKFKFFLAEMGVEYTMEKSNIEGFCLLKISEGATAIIYCPKCKKLNAR